jgi:hypothetical protein
MSHYQSKLWAEMLQTQKQGTNGELVVSVQAQFVEFLLNVAIVS